MMTYIDDQIQQFDLVAALQAVSAERRAYALRYKHELGQRQCVAAYLLLQRALQQQYGIEGDLQFAIGEHGKPSLVGHPGIHFNISHCREAVACAVSDSPVGIDIESTRRYSPMLLDYTMNADERHQVTSAARPDEAFIRLWTMKEAVLKLTGEGISRDLHTVLTDRQYRFATVIHPTYICTTAQF